MILSNRNFLPLVVIALLTGCSDDDPANGKISLGFAHHADGAPVVFNDMRYTDAAGNMFEVKELQYFVSDVTLVSAGSEVRLSNDDAVHYVDTNIPATLTWDPEQQIPAGTYTAIRFTFGLSEEKNIPGTYVNPPESNMFWPYSIGGDNGGYHYMKFNGFWMNETQPRTPFNVHIGVGQTYNEQEEVTGFIQNYFSVTVPVTFTIDVNDARSLSLIMDVKSWFDSPQVYDHEDFGMMIMTDQAAMSMICNNGKDAFSIVAD